MRFKYIWLILAAVASVEAQTGPFPAIPAGATSYNLGSYLENQFQLQLGTCIAGGGKKTLTIKEDKPLGKSVTLSAVPLPLISNLNLTADQVTAERPESVARVLSYVYSAQTMAVSNPDNTSYVEADYLQDPSSMLPAGRSSALYAHSCSSTIAGNMKANLGFKFPLADVSSALQADFSNQNAAQLALISGLFTSPIWGMYKSQVSADWQTYGTLLLWEWYKRHKVAVSDNVSRYLLTQFDGVSLYRLYSTKRDADGKLTVSAGFAAPVASVDVGIQAAFNLTAQARMENFAVVVRNPNGKEQTHFEPLPSVATLISDIKNAAAHLDPKTSNGRLVMGRNTHSQVLAGVPKSLCDRNLWRPALAAGVVVKGTLAVLSAQFDSPVTQGAAPTCTFSVGYTPDAVGAGDQVTLTYSLATSLDATNTISVVADSVSLSSNGLPKLVDTTSDGVPSVSNKVVGPITFREFAWSVDFPVADDPTDKLSAAASSPLELTLKCGTDRSITPVNGTFLFSAATSTLTLSLKHPTNDSNEKLDLNSFEPCILAGRVSLTTTNGIVIPRDIPSGTSIFYAKKPVPPPVPLTPANVSITTAGPLTKGTPVAFAIAGDGFDPTSIAVNFTGPGCTPCTVPNAALADAKTPNKISGTVTLSSSGAFTVSVQNGSTGAPVVVAGSLQVP